MLKVNDIREHFKSELKAERFTVDKTGAKTIEMIGASFLADEPAIFGTVNQEYVNAEIDWYLSGSTNIYDIYNDDRDPPKAWQYCADDYGNINSNYGYLIFDPLFHNQYEMALQELINNTDGRRASMIYTRPSIWIEYSENGKNDFICTNSVTYYIRDGYLHAVVQMRSNDVIFGYKNDYAWQRFILNRLVNDVNLELPPYEEEVIPGDIIWQVQNLHVYERHFDLVK
jgi:thymidylate synthase